MTHSFVAQSIIEAPVADVFAFHERSDAFELLLPPWALGVVVRPPMSLHVGTTVQMYVGVWPLRTLIEAEHVAFERNAYFEDVMRRGPFAHWHHRHLFEPHPRGCRLTDAVEYALPVGPLGRTANAPLMRPFLRRMFTYRHRVTRRHVTGEASHRLAPAFQTS